MKPNFHNVKIKVNPKEIMDVKKWEYENHISKDWLPAEQIAVKAVYTVDDLAGMEHLNYAAGIPPFYVALIPPCM